MRARQIVVFKRYAAAVLFTCSSQAIDLSIVCVSGRLPLYMFTVLYFVMLLQAATDSQLAD